MDDTAHHDLTALLERLTLERIDRDIFRSPHPGEGDGRLFGGQVAAQALRGAAATVDADHQVNALHCYFLRPGRFGSPVTFLVDRIRDGSSFTTRRVVAVQEGEAILNLDASFHAEEEGDEVAAAGPVDRVPGPDEVAGEDPDEQPTQRRPFDRRELEPPAEGSTRTFWIRARGDLPDDPVLHACVLTYLSDSGPVSAARRTLGGGGRWGWDGLDLITASLDHSMWFHRPVRADQWLLYDLRAVGVGRARGFTHGSLWTTTGELAVSVAQESLLRRRRPRS